MRYKSKNYASKDTFSPEIDSKRAPEEVESSPDGRVKVAWPWAEQGRLNFSVLFHLRSTHSLILILLSEVHGLVL